jgi:hypothetical protein
MEIISRLPQFTTINNYYQWKDSRQRRSCRGLIPFNKVLPIVLLIGLFSLCKVTNSSYVNETQYDEEECPTEELNSTVVYVEFSSKIVKNGMFIYSQLISKSFINLYMYFSSRIHYCF